MRMIRSSRVLVVVACVLAWFVAARAADRSTGAMADAAGKLVAALTPDQKKAALFPFDGSEREHWGFVPTEIFARNGLTVGSMSERSEERRVGKECRL